MNLEEIIAKFDKDEYRSACESARRAAPYTGQKDPPEVFDSDIPDEVVDMIWYSDKDIPYSQKLNLAFLVYEQMPDSIYMMHIPYEDLPIDCKQTLWAKFKEYLSGDDDALASPVTYSLWCDYFEDARLVNEAWNILVTDDANDRLLQRVLINSGPVPFDLKVVLYDRLIEDECWHYFIYRSLLHSSFDVYGQTDEKRAVEYLKSLNIPPDTVDLELLNKKLGLEV